MAADLGGKSQVVGPRGPDAAFILALVQSRNARPFHTKVDEQKRVDGETSPSVEKMFLKLPSSAIFFFFVPNKNFSLHTVVLPCPRRVR
jgi:hypothetical protein